MFQISVSGSRPSHPAIIVGGTPFLIDRVDLAVTRTVIPFVVGQVGRLFSTLLLDDRNDHAGFFGTLRHVAVTARAVRVVGALAGGQRRRDGGDGVVQRGRRAFVLLA